MFTTPQTWQHTVRCRVDAGPHAGKHGHAAALKAADGTLLFVACRNTAPAESLIDLFMSVKHVSIFEAIHLLEHSCEFNAKEGKQRSFALLQVVTVLANRLGAMGAGSLAESNAAAAGAASKGQHAYAVVARRLAKVPGLLPMLREMVQVVDRASVGVLCSQMPVFPAARQSVPGTASLTAPCSL